MNVLPLYTTEELCVSCQLRSLPPSQVSGTTRLKGMPPPLHAFPSRALLASWKPFPRQSSL